MRLMRSNIAEIRTLSLANSFNEPRFLVVQDAPEIVDNIGPLEAEATRKTGKSKLTQ